MVMVSVDLVESMRTSYRSSAVEATDLARKTRELRPRADRSNPAHHNSARLGQDNVAGLASLTVPLPLRIFPVVSRGDQLHLWPVVERAFAAHAWYALELLLSK
jgi:hypothetical protein